jgi:hypothetical protein
MSVIRYNNNSKPKMRMQMKSKKKKDRKNEGKNSIVTKKSLITPNLHIEQCSYKTDYVR